MKKWNYYNEIDPFTVEWIKNLINKGLVPNGEVDTRSITEVQPEDLREFTQCHFFAGILGWSLALRLAGWPDDRPVWTGSCPCQPFSVAGKGAGTDDPRHLWPHFFRLISACKPEVVMGEQVAGKAGYGWLDGVRSDLEGEGYACDGVDIPACAVDAPHIRQRLYWVANAESIGRGGRPHDEDEGWRQQPPADPCEGSDDMADADDARREGRAILPERADEQSAWSRGVEWRRGADGKTRRVKSGVCLLVNGVPARVGRLRAYGNAIVPQVAKVCIEALMDILDEQ